MTTSYYRRCPSCAIKNNPEVLRCACGTLLAGIDLSSEDQTLQPSTLAAPTAAMESANLLCSHADCAQPNPPGSVNCIYCDRPITAAPKATSSTSQKLPASLFNLPSALKTRYRITEAMPAKGAEAELLLVQPITNSTANVTTLVAKIYRHGILPKASVQERIARIDRAHRVEVIEAGISDGYAYELMEYCQGGSLRNLLDSGGKKQPLTSELVRAIAQELAIALADVHAHGLVHRDLKPENILIRSTQPLDLVLTDFGIASILDTTQRYTGVAHTLPYAAPESLSGVIDAKADYWALGMIVLEAATGQHPFSALSDAVIMHTLTTRNINTSQISDPNIAKLARGLLQRDPQQRWGASEIQRWLANDATLPDPQLNQASESGRTYNQPYHLGEQRCYHPEQLGVALANHWELGIADILNGQLLAWFRDVQKDQNVVRLLLDQRSDPRMSVDVQLLNLILHLAPGIPAVWHGQSIALSAILEQTKSAIKGDEKAIQWLNHLYQYRVLEIYAKAGNQAAAEIVQRWNVACDQFYSTWEIYNNIISKSAQKNSHEPVNIDQLMYGNQQLNRPYLSTMHAQILAFCYDQNWGEKKRVRINAELTHLSLQCPWLTELGNPQTMSGIELLVVESLLPEARKAAEKQLAKSAANELQLKEDCQATSKQINSLLAQLRTIINNRWATESTCEELNRLCDEYFQTIAQIRASGRVDVEWMEMRKSALKPERNLHAIVQNINKLSEHRAITAGWLNQQTLAPVVLSIFILPLLLHRVASSISPIIYSAIGLVIAWRFLPVYVWMRDIKNIGRKM